jgi:hypothetical protein
MAAAPALRALRAETSEGGWPLRVLAVAGARRAAAHLLQQARRLNRQALLLWLPVLAVAPALMPLGVAVFAAGALGEWLARRPALGPGTFLVGYAGECLAYSLGRIEGLLVQTWRRAWLGPPLTTEATHSRPCAQRRGRCPGPAVLLLGGDRVKCARIAATTV